jgi:hypothetical protein
MNLRPGAPILEGEAGAMAIIEMSAHRRVQPPEPASSSFQRFGGVREFSTFTVLIFCFAIIIGFQVHREHRKVGAVALRLATAVQQVAAITTPNPRSHAPVSATRADFSFSRADAVEIGAAAGNVVNSAADSVNMVVKTAWDPALWLSNQVVGYVSDTWVNPVTGDRLFFDAAPGAFNLAVSILALAMIAVVMMALAGPVYAGWKSMRVSRAHVFRYR